MFPILHTKYSKQKITDNQTAPSGAVIYGDDKMIPNKWGQGQLFAFSALDGDSFFTDDFTGTLSGDKIGVIFHTKKRRTLYFSEMKDLLPKIRCIASDIIALDTLAGELKGIVNFLFKKVGGGSYEFIPSVITDFDSLANQGNLVTMVKNLVGVLYTAGVTNHTVDVLLPFLNFLLGWKTDPQEIADPKIWTSFRDGNDYAFQWSGNGVYPSMDADYTMIHFLNNSSGMLEIHRNSSTKDHEYAIQIKSVTSDATVNTLTFNFGDGYASPYETIDIKVGGKYNGEEAVTVTIAYEYLGKDGKAIGGTQYTSVSFFISNKYEAEAYKKVFKKFMNMDVPQVWDANPKGCEHCRNGYHGRLAFQEVLEIDDDIITKIYF